MSNIDVLGTAARLLQEEPGTTFSATLVLEPVGYLSVKALFLCEPIKDLTVSFYGAQPDGARGSKVKDGPGALDPPEIKTNADGVAKLDFLVPTGNYVCSIDHQPDILVPTVEALDQPFIAVLPIGRPYFDLNMK